MRVSSPGSWSPRYCPPDPGELNEHGIPGAGDSGAPGVGLGSRRACAAGMPAPGAERAAMKEREQRFDLRGPRVYLQFRCRRVGTGAVSAGPRTGAALERISRRADLLLPDFFGRRSECRRLSSFLEGPPPSARHELGGSSDRVQPISHLGQRQPVGLLGASAMAAVEGTLGWGRPEAPTCRCPDLAKGWLFGPELEFCAI